MAETSQSSPTQPSGGKNPLADIKVGQMLGRFRIITRLGKGSMGAVVRAEDVPLQRPVALKLLPTTGNDEQQRAFVEQSIREARSAAQLIHPNIVQIFEIGKAPGLVYIAMEVLDGGSFEDVVKTEGRLFWRRAVNLMLQAVDAIAYAHEHAVVHRDLKPANLMITDTGHCKVTDFGLAHYEFRTKADGTEDRIVGTPHFMAPECLEKKVLAPADIYSLAAVLWFLLTGSPPYKIAKLGDVAKVGRDIKLPDLRQMRPEVPDQLVQVIEQALKHDPGDRPASARQFAAALREALESAEKPPAETVTIHAGRHWKWIAIIASIVAVAALGVMSWALATRQPAPPATSAPTSTSPTDTADDADDETPPPPPPVRNADEEDAAYQLPPEEYLPQDDPMRGHTLDPRRPVTPKAPENPDAGNE